MGVIVWVNVPGPALSRLGITLRAGAVLVCSGLGAQKWTGKAGVARRSVYCRVVDRGLCPPRRIMDPQLFFECWTPYVGDRLVLSPGRNCTVRQENGHGTDNVT